MNEFDELAPYPHKQEPLSPMDAPMPSAAEKSAKHSRRTFLFKLSLALNGAVGAVLAVPILGYVLAPLARKDSSYNSWIPLARVDSMPVGATRLVEYLNPVRTPTDGQTDKVACWTRRLTETTYEVFAINCAHLGCPVRWFEQSQLFLCPCHGGSYYADGSRAAGPPERGLFKYDVRVTGDTVYIHAGEMPTLSNHACAGMPGTPLVAIQPTTEALNVNLIPSKPAADGRDA